MPKMHDSRSYLPWVVGLLLLVVMVVWLLR